MIEFVGPIKDVCLGIYDGPHATPKESDVGPVFLGIKNVTKDGRLDLSEIRHVSEQEFPQWTRRVVPRKDDIVFSYEATLHLYALIPEGFRGCLGRRMALVRPDTTKVVPRFLHYYFLSPAWKALMLSNVMTGATVDRIPIARFPNFEVRLPRLSAQQRIADTLSAYDDLIENNRRRIALLEQSARLLYREWFVHLRFPGHEHVKVVDGVPEGWTRSPVSKLATLAGGKQFESDKLTDAGAYPVFGGNGIQGYAHEKTHDDFVIAFGRVGAYCGSVHWSYEGAWINNNASSLIPHEYPELFLHHMLHCDFRNYRKGAAHPFIPNGVLSTISFIGPSRMLAAEFCEQVRSMRLQQLILAKQNKKLAQARDLLLPRLMSGDLMV